MQATASAYIEASLSREFEVAWMARADGAGNEIADVTDAEIDAFSSRRDSVTAMQAEMARQFQGNYDRAPSQRELLSIHRTAQASTPESKAKGPIDFDQGARVGLGVDAAIRHSTGRARVARLEHARAKLHTRGVA